MQPSELQPPPSPVTEKQPARKDEHMSFKVRQYGMWIKGNRAAEAQAWKTSLTWLNSEL